MTIILYPTEHMQGTAKTLRRLIEDAQQNHAYTMKDILTTAESMPANTLGAFQGDITQWNQSLGNVYEVMKMLADQVENAAGLMEGLDQDIAQGFQPS